MSHSRKGAQPALPWQLQLRKLTRSIMIVPNGLNAALVVFSVVFDVRTMLAIVGGEDAREYF